jgi:hypothetical protein
MYLVYSVSETVKCWCLSNLTVRMNLAWNSVVLWNVPLVTCIKGKGHHITGHQGPRGGVEV